MDVIDNKATTAAAFRDKLNLTEPAPCSIQRQSRTPSAALCKSFGVLAGSIVAVPTFVNGSAADPPPDIHIVTQL